MVGRPKGSSAPRHLSMETKAKLQARRELREKEKELKKLEKKVSKARTNLADKKHVLKKVELAVDPKEQQSTNKNTVLTESEFEKAPKKVRDFIEENKESIVFKPNDGPQTDFLAAGEQDVLYGGAAGGGKSFAMLVDPLRFMHRSEHRALLLRRSMPELRELIDKSRELYPKAFPGAKFREVEKVWKFPSGATLEFGYLDRDADVYRYQGQSYSWIGIDELTQYPTEFPLQYLQSRLRTTDLEIKPYIRCTANPGGVGGHWVRKRYLTPAPPNEAFKGPDGLTRKFIPARLEDNPYLSKDGRYEQMLASLPPVQRKQLLEGNWDVAEGAAFVEFNPEIHVIPPFKIPIHWAKYKGVDYGYAAESCCVWSTIDPDDDTLIIYRELYKKGLTGSALAEMITAYEKDDHKSIQGVLDTAAWNKTGVGGPTVGETLVRAGHKLRPADKNRIQGKIQIHEYLKQNKTTGRPRLQIFSNCINLIRELQSIPVDPNKPEDVDTKASDHAYDALRYLIMSRPSKPSAYSRMKEIKKFTPSDPTFGY
tara:strand:- start:720 stop:2336 length:1617 start_codon:yes stop_codon:yes gene_type:complete